MLPVRGHARERTGVRRQRTPGGWLPHDGIGHRVVHDLPQRGAVAVEDLERLVDVVRQEESGDRRDGIRAAELVYVGLSRRRGIS